MSNPTRSGPIRSRTTGPRERRPAPASVTALSELAPGEELSEEELAGVAGGARAVGTYIDPPGICQSDG